MFSVPVGVLPASRSARTLVLDENVRRCNRIKRLFLNGEITKDYYNHNTRYCDNNTTEYLDSSFWGIVAEIRAGSNYFLYFSTIYPDGNSHCSSRSQTPCRPHSNRKARFRSCTWIFLLIIKLNTIFFQSFSFVSKNSADYAARSRHVTENIWRCSERFHMGHH